MTFDYFALRGKKNLRLWDLLEWRSIPLGVLPLSDRKRKRTKCKRERQKGPWVISVDRSYVHLFSYSFCILPTENIHHIVSLSTFEPLFSLPELRRQSNNDARCKSRNLRCNGRQSHLIRRFGLFLDNLIA